MDSNKDDDHKVRFDLVTPHFTAAMARVMTHGAKKYGPNTWQSTPEFRARYIAALHRHINAFQQYEDNDPDSGESHLAHAACNLMFLFWSQIAQNPSAMPAMPAMPTGQGDKNASTNV